MVCVPACVGVRAGVASLCCSCGCLPVVGLWVGACLAAALACDPVRVIHKTPDLVAGVGGLGIDSGGRGAVAHYTRFKCDSITFRGYPLLSICACRNLRTVRLLKFRGGLDGGGQVTVDGDVHRVPSLHELHDDAHGLGVTL